MVLIWLLLAAVGFFGLFVLLPALIEWKLPADSGPRRFPEKTIAPQPIPSLEIERRPMTFDRLVLKVDNVRVRSMGERLYRIMGDFEIPPHLEVYESLIVNGNLIIGEECLIHGSIKAYGSVTVGRGTVIEGNLVADGDIILEENAVVKGSVDAGGSLTLRAGSAVGVCAAAERDIFVYENVLIGGRMMTGGTVRILAPTPRPLRAERPART